MHSGHSCVSLVLLTTLHRLTVTVCSHEHTTQSHIYYRTKALTGCQYIKNQDNAPKTKLVLLTDLTTPNPQN